VHEPPRRQPLATGEPTVAVAIETMNQPRLQATAVVPRAGLGTARARRARHRLRILRGTLIGARGGGAACEEESDDETDDGGDELHALPTHDGPRGLGHSQGAVSAAGAGTTGVPVRT